MKTVNFSNRLNHLRKENHLTQRQLAERLGVQKSIVSYYETGDRYPSYDILIRIAKMFHVSTDYLLGIEGRKTIDVSDLLPADIEALEMIANLLRQKNESGH